MLTADQFYTCDDARRVATRLGEKYLESVRSVEPHSYEGTVQRNLSGGVAESWHFNFLDPTAQSGALTGATKIFFGNFYVTVNHFAIPSGDYALFARFEDNRFYDADSGMNPILSSEPSNFSFVNFLATDLAVQYNLQAGAALWSAVSVQFSGYKISE